MGRLVACGFVLLAVVAGRGARLGAAVRPNLILIVADDLGYGDLGCYGGMQIQTPSLDRLAQSGLRFTQFYAAGAVCTPSRASFLTGCYPLRFGITRHFLGNDQEQLPPGTATLPRLLGDAGYATAHVGKWHLGGATRKQAADRAHSLPGPNQHGFDHYLTYFEDPELQQSLFNDGKFHRTTARYLVRDDQPVQPSDEHWTDYVTQESLRRIDEFHAEQRPFFLYVCYDAPHTPYEPSPAKFLEPYQGAAQGDDLLYRGMVSHLDAGIGQILDRLRALEIAEKTLVLFTSDNGPSHQGSPGPWKGGKADLHEGGIRVPLVASWPGRIAAGATTDELAHGNDLLPTLCAAAGVMLSADLAIDGISLWPLMADKKPLAGRPTLFWQMDLYTWYPQPGKKPEPYATEVARSGKWKLLARDGKPLELFDMERDPFERTNLLVDEPQVAGQLVEELRAWLQEARNRRE